MSYFTAPELSLILPAHVSVGTNTDPLTLGEVGSMIYEVSADLDLTAAGAGYAVPISPSAPISYAAMQMAAKNGVGWRVLSTIFPNMGGPGDKSSLAAEYRDAYKDFKKMLAAGNLPLVDSPNSSAGRALPRSRSTTGDIECGIAASIIIPITWEP